MAPSVAARNASPAALSATPIHSRRLTSWPKTRSESTVTSTSPPAITDCTTRDRRERERADVEAPRRRRHDAADHVDRRAEQRDRAVHGPAPLHRRGRDRAAVLEQEADHGGQRADDREHDAELDGEGQAGKGRRAAPLPSAAMPLIEPDRRPRAGRRAPHPPGPRRRQAEGSSTSRSATPTPPATRSRRRAAATPATASPTRSPARRRARLRLKLVNFGCGGETTVSLLTRVAVCRGPGPGGRDYAGTTQIAAAERVPARAPRPRRAHHRLDRRQRRHRLRA